MARGGVESRARDGATSEGLGPRGGWVGGWVGGGGYEYT